MSHPSPTDTKALNDKNYKKCKFCGVLTNGSVNGDPCCWICYEENFKFYANNSFKENVNNATSNVKSNVNTPTLPLERLIDLREMIVRNLMIIDSMPKHVSDDFALNKIRESADLIIAEFQKELARAVREAEMSLASKVSSLIVSQRVLRVNGVFSEKDLIQEIEKVVDSYLPHPKGAEHE